MDISIKTKYQACMLAHALGDTIGFRNGIWEFNYGSNKFQLDDLLEIFYDFIHLGGVNHLKMKGWMISDDTILHLATAESYLEAINDINNIDNVINIMIKKFIESFNDMKDRFPGMMTETIVNKLKTGFDWKKLPYDDNAGGSGASMRTLCIGLIFYGDNNREKLIEHSIEASRMTHNCVVGYLGGLVSALFTAYAIEGIQVNKWPHMLVELLESNIVDNYIKNTRGYNMYNKEKHIFIGKWKQYIDDKYKENTHTFKRPMINLVQRSQYYHNTFRNSEKGSYIGSGGDDSVIIAYDCLVDAGVNWEKLIVYSMLHIGDTDTTGSIAGGWYGALYGYTDIPQYMLDNVEYKDRITDVGLKLYNKYYKN